MTPAAFLVRFPEFTAAPTPLVEAVLVEAESRAGTADPIKVGYLAAHLLAISPQGRALRTTPQGGYSEANASTPYQNEYLSLVRQDGGGPWV